MTLPLSKFAPSFPIRNRQFAAPPQPQFAAPPQAGGMLAVRPRWGDFLPGFLYSRKCYLAVTFRDHHAIYETAAMKFHGLPVRILQNVRVFDDSDAKNSTSENKC